MNGQKVSSAAFALACGLLVFLAASPAFALPQVCWAQCSCSSSCSTICTLDGPVPQAGGGKDGEPQSYSVITCGEYGICSGSSSCPPTTSCPTSCTYYIYGTSGNDTISGGSASECIYAYSGNDTVDGNAGDDCLWGGYGTDTLYGGSGYDFADGGPGYDYCSAEITVNCP